ncbi:type II toxin-antitoxin system VapC family toxin [Mesorhizobium qingshengii]|uniref:Ribonuclease VapC n=1 Tax=Mesorhizobium qingshengii TaxID=1165689 RepID=A0ABT4R3Q3_9HYPH|nr:type II toxin-antitoxin system VapC family toxin [Mesorhizobium qingshengii]MCZ8548463.1 type II toxin-antitoxin system VapC family toxin [Mesorhizobium qingshengii]
MFVDASAIIAIIGDEDDGLALAARLGQAASVRVSPIVVYEAVAGLARRRACPIEEAEELVTLMLDEIPAQMIEINGAIGGEAIRAFHRFGKGRHKADLNMGDCFAYACAKLYDIPLLFKGNDFVHTDIEVA